MAGAQEELSHSQSQTAQSTMQWMEKEDLRMQMTLWRRQVLPQLWLALEEDHEDVGPEEEWLEDGELEDGDLEDGDLEERGIE